MWEEEVWDKEVWEEEVWEEGGKGKERRRGRTRGERR